MLVFTYHLQIPVLFVWMQLLWVTLQLALNYIFMLI